jgi:hypothetical protein
MEKSHEDLEGRGLPGAIGSEIPEDLTWLDFEVQIDENRNGPRSQVSDGVTLGEPGDCHRRGHGRGTHAASELIGY